MDIAGRLEGANPNQAPTMSTVSIRITTATRKELEATLSRAFKAGDLPMVKRVTALLGIARDEPVTVIAQGVGVSPSTVYGWLRAFLLEGVAGLRVHWRGGRPRKLTKTQRERLATLSEGGPRHRRELKGGDQEGEGAAWPVNLLRVKQRGRRPVMPQRQRER